MGGIQHQFGKAFVIAHSWSYLVAGDEGLYQPMR